MRRRYELSWRRELLIMRAYLWLRRGSRSRGDGLRLMVMSANSGFHDGRRRTFDYRATHAMRRLGDRALISAPLLSTGSSGRYAWRR